MNGDYGTETNIAVITQSLGDISISEDMSA
jgi:hypothetical protein